MPGLTLSQSGRSVYGDNATSKAATSAITDGTCHSPADVRREGPHRHYVGEVRVSVATGR